MNLQSETNSPAGAAGDPQPEGRPRALNPAKRSEIIELISDGLGLEQAARLVQCSVRTIRREMKRDPEFGAEVRRSEKFAQINPLRALQRMIHHNWRVAAWLLERLFPERFGRRPQANAFGARQARQLLNEVLQTVHAEVYDTAQRDRIDGRIRAAFEYRIQVYCTRKRSSAGLRQATEWFNLKEASPDPLADFGLPNLDVTSNSLRQATAAAQPQIPEPNSSKRRTAPPERPLTMNELLQDFIDELSADPLSPVPPPKQPKTPNVAPTASPADKTPKN